MNKLKILSLTAVALLGMAVSGHASLDPNRTPLPLDQNGNASGSDNAGFLHMRNSGTSEMIVCSGRCLLKALIMSTGPQTSYLTIRNTSVAQGNGAKVLDIVGFYPSNTGPAGGRINLDILLDKGISATLSSVAAQQEVTVLYRDLD